MVVHALRGCGLDPAYIVGGEVRSTGTNAGWGTGEWLVVEADESDRSLLKLHPRIAVVTNAELDHHTTYSSLRDVHDTFRGLPGAAAQAVVWDRPDLLALAGDTPVTAVRRARPRAGGVRLALRPRRRRGRARRPGRAQRPQRRRGADGLPARRRRPAAAAAALRDFTGAGPALRAARDDRGGRARGRRLRPPPDRGRGHDRRRPHARPAPRVAVFQPHLFSRTRPRRAGSAPRSPPPTSSS